MRRFLAGRPAAMLIGLLPLSSLECTEAFSAGEPDVSTGASAGVGTNTPDDSNSGASGAHDEAGGMTTTGGTAGEAGETAGEAGETSVVPTGGTTGQTPEPTCNRDSDCPQAASTCSPVSCVDGACLQAPIAEHSPCAGGACDAAGTCVASSCDSKVKDGDETGVDCGGSCALCANGAGCVSGGDCKSGVCTNQTCQPSSCTDTVKNGDEADVDCGGTCSVKCALNKACAVPADCAIAAGGSAQSVRCVQRVCTSSEPPALGIRYWQDFEQARLIKDTAECGATDDYCLHGHGASYPMFGLGATGAAKGLTKALLFTAQGAIGSGGKFDGTYCLTRVGTNLSFAGANAFSAMAWVKSTRTSAPWEGAVIGGLDRYFIAVDANPVSQRFLAALATSQSTSFAYTSAPATGQLPSGEWHHVAEVYDTAAATMTQYVDGLKVFTKTQAGTVTSGAVDGYLGCRKDAKLGQFFIGSLDEIVLYTRALSAAEVRDYVRRSKPGG